MGHMLLGRGFLREIPGQHELGLEYGARGLHPPIQGCRHPAVERVKDLPLHLRDGLSRMARAALGWGVRELAAAAKVSIDTIARFERGDELKERTIEAIHRALEAQGIDFIDDNGGGPGVRLKKRQTRKKP